MKVNLSSPCFALICHWGRISSPNPFSPSQLTSCLQAVVCKVALEKYSGISAFVAQGWSSAWMPVCLYEAFSSLEAMPVSLSAFITWEVLSFGWGQIVCPFVFLHLLKDLCVCLFPWSERRILQVTFHFRKWFGLMGVMQDAFIPSPGIQGSSLWRQSSFWDLCSPWCSEEIKERNFYCDDFYLMILVTFREAQSLLTSTHPQSVR